ncbi:hypothetical protein NL108_017481 [Boleophthalmus pectinirostris]|nr:hypothetical protein NL108_017481 [Boleophthalmus pectinirostris]
MSHCAALLWLKQVLQKKNTSSFGLQIIYVIRLFFSDQEFGRRNKQHKTFSGHEHYTQGRRQHQNKNTQKTNSQRPVTFYRRQNIPQSQNLRRKNFIQQNQHYNR